MGIASDLPQGVILAIALCGFGLGLFVVLSVLCIFWPPARCREWRLTHQLRVASRRRLHEPLPPHPQSYHVIVPVPVRHVLAPVDDGVGPGAAAPTMAANVAGAPSAFMRAHFPRPSVMYPLTWRAPHRMTEQAARQPEAAAAATGPLGAAGGGGGNSGGGAHAEPSTTAVVRPSGEGDVGDDDAASVRIHDSVESSGEGVESSGDGNGAAEPRRQLPSPPPAAVAAAAARRSPPAGAGATATTTSHAPRASAVIALVAT